MLRAAVVAEGHRLPADFCGGAVPVPDTWPEHGAGYVQVSPACDADAAEARARGRPTMGEGSGAHLDVATAPTRVAGLVG